MDVMLVGKAYVQEEVNLLLLDGVKLFLTDQVESLGLLLDLVWLFVKQVSVVARSTIYTIYTGIFFSKER